MHVFKMPAEIAALSEGLVALRASERSQPGVFAEVVPQVAALLERAGATRELAFEE